MADDVREGRFKVRVGGPYACFTRPEMKAERVSYDVMTPSAARGVLEAILWKPAIRWVIERIDVLAPIVWGSVRRNEVGSKASLVTARTAMQNGHGQIGLIVEEDRQQRASLLLTNVDYLVHARLELTAKAGPDDPLVKFEQMFLRRVEKGQYFHHPYLGCREFPASFSLVPRTGPEPQPITETRELGWMLHDFDYRAESPVPRFFEARLQEGRMMVPAPQHGEGKP